jgi:hypothetical protein
MSLLAPNRAGKGENLSDARENGLFHSRASHVKALSGEFCKSFLKS